MLSVEARLGARWSLRVDGEWSQLSGPPAPAGQDGFSSHRDLRTQGASLNGVVNMTDDQLAPYLLAGIGAYRLQRVGGDPSPYGTTGAIQVGVGFDSNIWGRVNPFIEARAQVHVTDYGADEFSPTVFWPVILGLRIR